MKHLKTFNGITAGLALAIAGVLCVLSPSLMSPSTLQARTVEVKQQSTGDWRQLSELDVASGSTIPSGRHVFFHIPSNIDGIDREVLLGHRGTQVRYWGYCFPEQDDPDNPPQGVGFPGKIFLSEAERAARKKQEDLQNRVNPFLPPNQRPKKVVASPIHHQLDTFRGGMTCYIMSEKELPIGTDEDGDGLNSQLEKQYFTDPTKADTDEDGIPDGIEAVTGTNAIKRDTDGDGILDGIEDSNQDGKVQQGETDPRKKDTDADTLCDGMCNEDKVRRVCKDNKAQQCIDVPYGMLMGEDKNLNGTVDQGESDPTKQDTVGDGVRDDVRFFKCLLDGGKNC